MSRWFRWYEQTCEDGKFRAVARLSRVTVRDVIAVWAFMLEDAANMEHRGVCNRNEDFIASVLDFADGEVERIISAMQDVGMLSIGHGGITVCNWNKRQFESDADPTASRRQREKRERDKSVSNVPVTRDTGGSEDRVQITETEKKDSRAVASATRTKPNSEFEEFWKEYPKRQGSADKQSARKSFEKLTKAGTPPSDLIAAARNYAAEVRLLGKENTEFVPMAATWLNKRRDLDYLGGPPASSVMDEAERQKLFAELHGNGQAKKDRDLRGSGAGSREVEGPGWEEPATTTNH